MKVGGRRTCLATVGSRARVTVGHVTCLVIFQVSFSCAGRVLLLSIIITRGTAADDGDQDWGVNCALRGSSDEEPFHVTPHGRVVLTMVFSTCCCPTTHDYRLGRGWPSLINKSRSKLPTFLFFAFMITPLLTAVIPTLFSKCSSWDGAQGTENNFGKMCQIWTF